MVDDLRAGRRVAGVAFSQLRRWPRRPVRAERTAGGWRLDGSAPWYTGWGLNDVMVLSGVDPEGTVVHALVEAAAAADWNRLRHCRLRPCVRPTPWRSGIHGLQIRDTEVVAEQSIEEWSRADALRTANASPAVFGLADSALDLLRRRGVERDDVVATATADRIGEQLDDVRADAYRLMDHVAAQESTGRRLVLRARSLRLLVEATTALVVAGAGASLLIGAPAQRKAREGLFLLVQAQTEASRRATLELWGR